MTVQQLIERLQCIEDKTNDVCISICHHRFTTDGYAANIEDVAELEDCKTNVVKVWLEGSKSEVSL